MQSQLSETSEVKCFAQVLNSLTATGYKLESCGARFLTTRLRNAPLSFAPTQTKPENNKFNDPDPGPTLSYSTWTGPKYFIINPK